MTDIQKVIIYLLEIFLQFNVLIIFVSDARTLNSQKIAYVNAILILFM